jgi:hypothetical protein
MNAGTIDAWGFSLDNAQPHKPLQRSVTAQWLADSTWLLHHKALDAVFSAKPGTRVHVVYRYPSLMRGIAQRGATGVIVAGTLQDAKRVAYEQISRAWIWRDQKQFGYCFFAKVGVERFWVSDPEKAARCLGPIDGQVPHEHAQFNREEIIEKSHGLRAASLLVGGGLPENATAAGLIALYEWPNSNPWPYFASNNEVGLVVNLKTAWH